MTVQDLDRDPLRRHNPSHPEGYRLVGLVTISRTARFSSPEELQTPSVEGRKLSSFRRFWAGFGMDLDGFGMVLGWFELFAGVIIRTPSKQITKVTISNLLVGQTASGPPSYIQVRHPGSDFRGPGAQKHHFRDQKPKKRVILSPLSDPPPNLLKRALIAHCSEEELL